MIRSLSNAQIEVAEVARHGVGFDKESMDTPLGSMSIGQAERIGLRAVFNPRPECVPSPDPLPFVHDHSETGASPCFINGKRHATEHPYDRYSPRPWGSFTPDPEFVRSPVNPILAAFRTERDGPWMSAENRIGEIDNYLYDLTFPKADDSPSVIFNATPEQVVDARKVLTKLRDVMEAGQ
jgi:hypothetical protein